MSRLAVLVIGHRKAGKSTTWYHLFRRKVSTGSKVRRLTIGTQTVDAFLISGSPEERKTYVAKIVGRAKPRLVLCSVQYRHEAMDTIDFFLTRGYALYVQWLNPGYRDSGPVPDSLGLMPYLLHIGATVAIRDATVRPRARVRDIEDFIVGWASNRRL